MANVRERIKVESHARDVSFRVATDIDKNYVKETFNERTREFYRYLPITSAARTRDILRRKLEMCWMRERIIRDTIELEHEAKTIKEMDSQTQLCDEFLDNLKKSEFERTRSRMQYSQESFQVLKTVQNRHFELEKQVEPLKMRIFLLANNFMRLLILQNFQFLIKPLEWRVEHDWIHRRADGSLEDEKESLETRTTRNLWSRDSMTVYSIKNFIEGEFASKPRPQRAFHSGQELLHALDENQTRSKQSLMKFHNVACAKDDIVKQSAELEIANQRAIEKIDKNMTFLKQRKEFATKRAATLHSSVNELLKKPLRESIASSVTRESATLVNFVFEKIILKHQDTSLSRNYTLREKMIALERKVFDLLAQIDQIPPAPFKEFESAARRQRRQDWRVARRAYRIECELNERIVQFQRCIAKPPPKKIHKGKRPRSELPKKMPKPKPPTPPLTRVEQDFLRTFTEADSRRKVRFNEKAKQTLEQIRSQKLQKCGETVERLIEMLGLE